MLVVAQDYPLRWHGKTAEVHIEMKEPKLQLKRPLKDWRFSNHVESSGENKQNFSSHFSTHGKGDDGCSVLRTVLAVETAWELLQRFSSGIYRKDDVPGLCIGTFVSSINTCGDTSEFSVATISKKASRKTTQTGIKYFSISSHSSTHIEVTICPTQLLWKLSTFQYLKGAQKEKGERVL